MDGHPLSKVVSYFLGLVPPSRLSLIRKWVANRTSKFVFDYPRMCREVTVNLNLTVTFGFLIHQFYRSNEYTCEQ